MNLPHLTFSSSTVADVYPSRIDFLRASEEELQRLSSTCDPATFGLDQKDVLDETYRKAGKLDSAYFATKLDVVSSGLMEAVRFDLLPGHQCQRQIRAELYKLNVYGRSFWRHYAVVGAVTDCMCPNLLAKFTHTGESSFFKAHKDTPRGPTMFGSLVVILPAPHEGGALLLRHGGAEWTFDSAQAVSEHSIENPLIAYAAFFSDVEHEVTTVSSGHRVTITYNLYFDDEENDTEVHRVKTFPPIESSFSTSLKSLLEDTSFLPNGGYIGFGLHHEYPTETQPSRTMTLNHLKKSLKGSDAVILKVCQELRLDVQVQMFYKDENVGLLLDHEPDFDDMVCHEEALWYVLKRYDKAKIVERDPSGYYDKNKNLSIDMEVLWATKRTPFNQRKGTYGAYGNEVMTDYVYGQFCIIVHVGPPGSRSTVQGAE